MKVLVLVSGGLDSSVCLASAVEKYGNKNVVALSIFYGQKHSKEIECAKDISAFYKVPYKYIDLKPIFENSDCCLLEKNDKFIPEGSYAEQLEGSSDPVDTYVPFRNGLFLSTACVIALSEGCGIIYYGAHADDSAGNAYPDTSEKFNEAMSRALFLGSGEAVKLEAPLINLTKKEVVAKGLKLKVPFELTWSCYKGGDKACGKCGTCIDRRNAFISNGTVDPIKYEDE